MPEEGGGVRAVGDEIPLAVQQRAQMFFEFRVTGGFVGPIHLAQFKHDGNVRSGVGAVHFNIVISAGLPSMVWVGTSRMHAEIVL